jgi:predicted metal-dependent hydrolase
MQPYSYTIIRRKRRSVGLSISPDNSLTVYAPQRVTREVIDAFVTKSADWIEKKIEKNKKMFPDYKPKAFAEGEQFQFLGEPVTLVIERTGRKKPVLSGKQVFVYVPRRSSKDERKYIRTQLTDWYRKNAREIIISRVTYFRKRIGVEYGEVRIKTLRSRWGSCSHQGNLNFNWKLILAPIHMIDYVVVHELCHLIHQNHSHRFWDEVKKHLPDYKDRRKWLMNYGLTFEL